MAEKGKQGNVPKRIFAALPMTERARSVVLGDDQKDNKNFLYTHNNSVFIRDIKNPTNVDIYTQHSKKAISAKYSPSGYYIASGDAAGKVRIWDTVNAEHILKNEFQPIAGPIKDIAWSPESNKIAICGEGREKFAVVFTADSGNTVGTISGQTKSCNSVSYRPARPFRIVVGSEDHKSSFFEGPPFKHNRDINDHTNFVNTVRYSPDGSCFITGGSDGQAFIYDGKTGDKIGQLGENEKGGKAHKGGIYGVCFKPDNTKVLTASGDKSAKVWNLATKELESTYEAGTAIEDMFLGCLWQDSGILVVSYNGYIHYLNEKDPSTCIKIVKGHIRPVTSLCLTEDSSYIYTADSSGRVGWNAETGDNEVIPVVKDGQQIQDITIKGDTLISIAIDDTLRFTSLGQSQSGNVDIKLESQPKKLAAEGGLIAVACENHIAVFKDGMPMASQKVNYDPVSVDILSGGTLIAFGGEKDKKVHLYDVSGGGLSEVKDIDNTGPVMDVKFSPDGQYIATAGGDRNVRCYNMADYKTVINYPGHTAKVTCLAWSPDSSRFATGSLDTGIAIWQPKTSTSTTKVIKGAHPMSHINKMVWIGNQLLVSAGHDSNVKQWEIE